MKSDNQKALEALDYLYAELKDKCSPTAYYRILEQQAIIRSQLSAQGWRTIDSAPRDGTEFNIPKSIILSDGEYVSLGRWSIVHKRWVASEIRAHIKYKQPTHWMPLPEAPTPPEGAGE